MGKFGEKLLARPRHMLVGLMLGVIGFGVIISWQTPATAKALAGSQNQPDPLLVSLQLEKTATPDALATVDTKPIETTTSPLKPQLQPPDCSTENCLALTFDDGPDPVTTPAILAILQRQQVQSTFFFLGYKVARYAPIVRQVAAEGQEIGNHSWDHKDFTKLRPEQMMSEIDQTQTALIASNVPAATLFRPPYGSINDSVKKTVPLPLILWNVDPDDWLKQDPNELMNAVLSHAKPGAIVILHDDHPVTVAALESIVTSLKQQYRLVTISQLLDTTQPHTAYYRR